MYQTEGEGEEEPGWLEPSQRALNNTMSQQVPSENAASPSDLVDSSSLMVTTMRAPNEMQPGYTTSKRARGRPQGSAGASQPFSNEALAQKRFHGPASLIKAAIKLEVKSGFKVAVVVYTEEVPTCGPRSKEGPGVRAHAYATGVGPLRTGESIAPLAKVLTDVADLVRKTDVHNEEGRKRQQVRWIVGKQYTKVHGGEAATTATPKLAAVTAPGAAAAPGMALLASPASAVSSVTPVCMSALAFDGEQLTNL